MINVFEPSVYSNTIDLLKEVHKSKWLGRGELSKQFEKNMSDYLGLGNFSTASCASHLIEAIIRVSSFESGSNIIIPSNSFPIIASVIISEGLECRIADIDPDTGNICFKSIESILDHNTRAIFITHYGGVPVDVKNLRALVGADIKIFEDSATALGSFVDGAAVGSDSDFSLWSFDAMKLVVATEGGGYSSRDLDLFNSVKSHLYLGLPPADKSGLDKVLKGEDKMWWEYQPTEFGTRSVFTNVQAAYGLASLEKIDERLQRLAVIRNYYEQNLVKEVRYIKQYDDSINKFRSNYFFTLQVDETKRDNLAKFLLKNGIYSTLRYFPINKIKFYSEKSVLLDEYPGTERFFAQSLNIPMHSNLTNSNLRHIVNSINKFYVG